MNKEKQIEEMANVIFESSPIPSVWRSDATNFAKALYNAGYRKASDVAREIFEEIEKILSKSRERYSVGGYHYDHYKRDNAFVEAFDELKKKYREEEK